MALYLGHFGDRLDDFIFSKTNAASLILCKIFALYKNVENKQTKTNLKFAGKHNRLQIVKAILSKKKFKNFKNHEDFIIGAFKLYYRVTVTKIAGY